jgi:hypothetical protein
MAPKRALASSPIRPLARLTERILLSTGKRVLWLPDHRPQELVSRKRPHFIENRRTGFTAKERRIGFKFLSPEGLEVRVVERSDQLLPEHLVHEESGDIQERAARIGEQGEKGMAQHVL